jgi:hypothetical protein
MSIEDKDEGTDDFCTKGGARVVGTRVRKVWGVLGDNVDVGESYIDREFTPQMRSARTDYRTTMKNGMPEDCAGFRMINGKLHAVMKNGDVVYIPKGTLYKRKD